MTKNGNTTSGGISADAANAPFLGKALLMARSLIGALPRAGDRAGMRMAAGASVMVKAEKSLRNAMTLKGSIQ